MTTNTEKRRGRGVIMSEVKHYWPEEIVGTGELVVYLSDYKELEERLRAAEVDAGRYRWLIEQGDSTQWMNILKADPDDFFSLEECITTLME